jgi:type I restriction enzyme S subunit
MVEWKKLGEVEDSGVLTLGRGQVISKIDMNDCPGDYPVYSSSSQNNGEIGRYGKYMFDDERITWSIDGGGKLFYRNGIKYSVTNVCGWLKVNDENKLNTKFLYYLLFEEWTNIIYDYNHKAHPSVIRNEYQIPVIPLTEQTWIVGILDTFTSAIDNLKEQIAQRRKQYEYYRDQLLDLEGKEGVEMKTLGEIGEFVRGNGIQKSDFIEDGYSCIHYGQIHAKYGFSATETISKIDKSLYDRCKKAKKGDVVLATTSEDAEGVAKPFVWLGDEDAAISGDAFVYHHDQMGKFMGAQFLTRKFMQFKVKYATGAKVVRISGDNMAKFEVALPSLQEQQRIVSILDTFESSIQNLEAQLKEREKQYEYYRNKLLTFD